MRGLTPHARKERFRALSCHHPRTGLFGLVFKAWILGGHFITEGLVRRKDFEERRRMAAHGSDSADAGPDRVVCVGGDEGYFRAALEPEFAVMCAAGPFEAGEMFPDFWPLAVVVHCDDPLDMSRCVKAMLRIPSGVRPLIVTVSAFFGEDCFPGADLHMWMPCAPTAFAANLRALCGP